jgi:hypothetical protein
LKVVKDQNAANDPGQEPGDVRHEGDAASAVRAGCDGN